MSMFTPEVINRYTVYYHADYRTMQRGQQLFRQQLVVMSEFAAESAICEVRDRQLSETVVIDLIGGKELLFTCTCHDQSPNLCEHSVAAYFTLSQYLVTEAHRNLQYQLSLALKSKPKQAPISRRQRNTILLD